MYLKTLLSVVTPQMYAAAYALPNTIRTTAKSTSCEFKNTGAVRIHANGFVACNLSASRFKAGSVLDIHVVSMVGNSSARLKYEAATKRLVERFNSLLPPDFQQEHVISAIAQEALLRRRVYNITVCNSNSFAAMPGPLLNILRKEFQGAINPYCAMYLTVDDIMTLNKRLQDCGVKQTIPAAPSLVVPFFSHSYEVACLEIISPKQAAQQIWLQDCPVATSCLLCGTDSSEYFLFSDTAHALRRNTQNATKEVGISVAINPDGKVDCWKPSRVCYVTRDPGLDLLIPAALARLGVACLITPYAAIEATTNYQAISWVDAVISVVTKLIAQESDVSDRAAFLLSTVTGTAELQSVLKQALQRANVPMSVIYKLDAVLHAGVIWQQGNTCIYSSGRGLVYNDPGSPTTRELLLTNFLPQATYSVRYESGDMYYNFQIYGSGTAYDVTLPSTCFDSAKRFMDALQAAVAFSGKATSFVPMVFSSTYFRPLLNTLYSHFATLPVKSGISTLGWNGTRSAYTTPVSHAIDTLIELDYYPKPGHEYLRYFTAPGVIAHNDTAGVPDELLNVIHICAGLIVRCQANHLVAPAPFSNTPTTRKSLAKLFSYIGQNGVVMLNQNMRAGGELACFQGYPVLASGYNRNQAKSCKTGLILLGEEGTTVAEYNDVEYTAAASYLLYVLRNLPIAVLRNHGPNFVPDAEIPSAQTLAHEGKLAIDLLDVSVTEE